MYHTTHSATRAQQRNVPGPIVELLQEHGTAHYTHHGAVLLHFTKKSREQIKARLKRTEFARVERFLNRYLVVTIDRSTIITVGVRYRPIYH